MSRKCRKENAEAVYVLMVGSVRNKQFQLTNCQTISISTLIKRKTTKVDFL